MNTDRFKPPSLGFIRAFRAGAGIGGFIAFAALVFYGGPLIGIGNSHPLAELSVQIAIIVVFGLILIAAALWRRGRRQRAAAALSGGMVGEGRDQSVLSERMRDAIATLKSSGGRRGDPLYDLPWYLIIGPPGAGKTTALVNSGLRFPLAGGGTATPIAGAGGTRYCDWWFTDDAVLVDTAGRYTTQDSDAEADRRSWLSFLDLLHRHRPRQPINGVIVAVSVTDLTGAQAANAEADADAIRARLAELHDHLKVKFPVYVVITKADMVAGFTEFFADFDEEERKQVWGATFETTDRTANLVGRVPAEYDLLVERLTERVSSRLQAEPDLRFRALTFGFPSQIVALKGAVSAFLARIFEPTRYHSNATLRGFYFASGTQEGTPFDQVVEALGRSYGIESRAAIPLSGIGKSYFIHDLLKKVVFPEAGWVTDNMAVVRWGRIVRAGMFGLVALIVAGVGLAWGNSYARNVTLIDATEIAYAVYRDQRTQLALPLVVSGSDLANVYPLLQALDDLRKLTATDQAALMEGFGLSQRPTLNNAASYAYQAGLDLYLRPRLMFLAQEQLVAHRDDPDVLYEALKVYLMLGGSGIVDKALIFDWVNAAWAAAFPNEETRRRLNEHLAAMLENDRGSGARPPLDGQLVASVQHTLVTEVGIVERALSLLRSHAARYDISDWVLVDETGGDQATIAFETTDGTPLDSLRVPAFYTYEGFQRAFLAQLPSVACELDAERWVLGTEATTIAQNQYRTIQDGLFDLYAAEFIAAWDDILHSLRLRPLNRDALAVISSPESPVRLLAAALRTELDLGAPWSGDPIATANADCPTAAGGIALRSQTPADFGVEPYLRRYVAAQDAVPGLMRDFDAGYQSHFAGTTVATVPGALETTIGNLNAAASRVAEPFGGMALAVATYLANEEGESQVAQLRRRYEDVVLPACSAVVGSPRTFPFDAGASGDAPRGQFAELFRPNGLIDSLVRDFSGLIEISGTEWRWRGGAATAGLSNASLQQFRRAAEIREAFFPTGGTTPGTTFSVTPAPGAEERVRLNLGGIAVTGPAVVSWPIADFATLEVIAPPSRQRLFGPPPVATTSVALNTAGEWAMFRLIAAGQVFRSGETVSVSYRLADGDVVYTFRQQQGPRNPISLPALAQFSCPSGL